MEETNKQITEKEYKALLDKHDWQYYYSDDHGVYMRGAANSATLHELKKGHPKLEVLFNNAYKKNNP